jgi:glycosyltransferase involved in cell wall biosynthesis
MIDSYGRERKNLMVLGDAFRGHAIETIAKCDAVTVTNKLLAENYARFTKKPIYILPNYVDLDWYKIPDKQIERVTDEIRIGWFGSQGHFEDLRMLIPVLDKILKKYPQVRFVYCGYGGMSSDKKLTEIGWGEDVFKELPRSRREFVIATKPEFWPAKHHTLDLDIGLCPLVDDYFNKCKTNIKWLEYAVMKTPAVVSDVLYGDYVKDGKDALVARTVDEWYDKLVLLIEDSKLRKKIGKNAHKRMLSDFNIDTKWHRFKAVYDEIVFNKPLDKTLSSVLRYQ